MALTSRAQLGARRLRSVGELLRFCPSPAFERFVDDEARMVLLRAANRVGKTRHCAYRAARLAVSQPHSRLRCIGPTNKHAQTVLGAYLADFLAPYLDPASYYIRGRGWNGGREKVVRLANGSYIELYSLEDSVDAHSGASLHEVVMDEPPSRAHYLENLARVVDTGGRLVIAATMVNRPVRWLRQMVEGEDASPTQGRTIHSSGWVQYVARVERQNEPWIPEAQVDFWLSAMDASPWQKAQRVDAAWEGGASDTRRFSAFTEANVVDELPRGSVSIGVAMDHGEVSGRQIAILILYSGSRAWVIDEDHPDHPSSPEEDAHRLLAMLRRNGIEPNNVDLAVGDINTAGKGASGLRVNDLIAQSIADRLGKRSPPFRIMAPSKVPGSVDWGQRLINFASRRGDLLVHPRCRYVLDMLRHWNGVRTPGTDMGELAHAADCLRYGLTAALGRVEVYARLRLD